MADLRGRRDFPEHGGLLEVLPRIPGALLVLRGALEIPAGHVEAAGVPEDVLERLRLRDAESGLADRDDHLHFVVIILRAWRIGDRRAGRDAVIARLHEIDRRLMI